MWTTPGDSGGEKRESRALRFCPGYSTGVPIRLHSLFTARTDHGRRGLNVSDSGKFHLHLVSDATGETLEAVTKACMVQFDSAEVLKHFWPMVRTARQMERILDDIGERPGLVLYTLVNPEIRDALEQGCAARKIPTLAVLDPVIQAVGTFLGRKARAQPGRQHAMDAAYFERIDAIHFTLAHDDGQLTDELDRADIILVGVSRTSKTPTSMYLANRGYKTANVPIVPEIPLPEALWSAGDQTLIVGLTTSPDRLVQVRASRLKSLQERRSTDYINLERIKAEVSFARRLFSQHGWPVIDVTRRSIEETAAAVINLYQQRFGGDMLGEEGGSDVA